MYGKRPNKEPRESKKKRRRVFKEKQKALGRCKHCNKPEVKGRRCAAHVLKQQKQDRIRKAKIAYGVHWRKQVLLLTINDQIKEIKTYVENTQN